MSARAWLVLLGLFAAPPARAAEAPVRPAPAKATHRTANFVVHAPTARTARAVAEAAERFRREQARLWLGKQLAGWARRCEVHIAAGAEAAGATTVVYYHGRVLRQRIDLQGPPDELARDVLAHEVTHTILAAHFGRPVPLWADEGAALLSEGPARRQRWEARLAEVLSRPGRAYPLRRLLRLDVQPADPTACYAQSYSLTRFLVEAKGRATFLAFVGDGLSGDWDKAVRRHYGFAGVDGLERTWRRQCSGKAVGKGAPPAGRR
jgi:hypothetical protein